MAHPTVALFATLLCACSAEPAAVPAALPPVAATPPPPHPDRSNAPLWTVTATQAECRQINDGDTLYRLQSAMNPLLAQAESDPSFGGAWIDYSPCYRLVLGFVDGQPRQWLIDASAPELRPLIAFARIPYSRSGQERLRTDIAAALGKAGIESIFVESLNQRPKVVVMTESDARLARSIIPPRHLDEIDIFVGDIRRRPE